MSESNSEDDDDGTDHHGYQYSINDDMDLENMDPFERLEMECALYSQLHYEPQNEPDDTTSVTLAVEGDGSIIPCAESELSKTYPTQRSLYDTAADSLSSKAIDLGISGQDNVNKREFKKAKRQLKEVTADSTDIKNAKVKLESLLTKGSDKKDLSICTKKKKLDRSLLKDKKGSKKKVEVLSVLSDSSAGGAVIISSDSNQKIGGEYNPVLITCSDEKSSAVIIGSSCSSDDSESDLDWHKDENKTDIKINAHKTSKLVLNSADLSDFESLEDIHNSLDDSGMEWTLADDDKNIFTYQTNRYYTDFNVKCRNCDERGHLSKFCTAPKKQPICFKCGEKGHVGQRCTLSICGNCSGLGHRQSDCSMKRINKKLPCYRCGMAGHQSTMCPDLWRQYHMTIKEGRIIEATKRRNKSVYCCNCSEEGHFAYECEEDPMDWYVYPTYPFIAKYDTSQKRKRESDAHELDRKEKKSKYNEIKDTIKKGKKSPKKGPPDSKRLSQIRTFLRGELSDDEAYTSRKHKRTKSAPDKTEKFEVKHGTDNFSRSERKRDNKHEQISLRRWQSFEEKHGTDDFPRSTRKTEKKRKYSEGQFLERFGYKEQDQYKSNKERKKEFWDKKMGSKGSERTYSVPGGKNHAKGRDRSPQPSTSKQKRFNKNSNEKKIESSKTSKMSITVSKSKYSGDRTVYYDDKPKNRGKGNFKGTENIKRVVTNRGFVRTFHI